VLFASTICHRLSDGRVLWAGPPCLFWKLASPHFNGLLIFDITNSDAFCQIRRDGRSQFAKAAKRALSIRGEAGFETLFRGGDEANRRIINVHPLRAVFLFWKRV
jgi:hypothetical protein